MIARTWHGRVPLQQAEAFHAQLLRTGIADYRAAPGCRGAWVWRRDELDASDGSAASWSHFLLVSLWEAQEDALRYAAGHDAGHGAVLYPGDDAFGLQPDEHVTHYEVLPGGFEAWRDA